MTRCEIICSGSGGQGMMFIGKLLARLSLEQCRHLTFFPSYGAEVRGGTSNCQIILSDEPIASPIVERATLQILMNQPSVDRFLPDLAEGGVAVVNLSMAQTQDERALFIPATEMAMEAGNIQAANVVMLAAAMRKTGLLGREETLEGVLQQSGRKGEKALAVSREAFARGWEYSASAAAPRS